MSRNLDSTANATAIDLSAVESLKSSFGLSLAPILSQAFAQDARWFRTW